jgi:hypothetical protein
LTQILQKEANLSEESLRIKLFVTLLPKENILKVATRRFFMVVRVNRQLYISEYKGGNPMTVIAHFQKSLEPYCGYVRAGIALFDGEPGFDSQQG